MRVLIADDSVLLRQGLALILAEGGHEVVAEAGDGESLVTQALPLRPDVVVTDIRMPPSRTDEGLRAASRLRAQWPGAPVLLLSQYVVAGYLPELLADGGGGLGYLLKDRVTDIDAFLEAVARVARGELVLDPEVVTQVLRRGRRAEPLAALTPREREVLELMAQGLYQCRYCRAASCDGGGGGEAHAADLRQAWSAAGRCRAPPGQGRAHAAVRLKQSREHTHGAVRLRTSPGPRSRSPPPPLVGLPREPDLGLDQEGAKGAGAGVERCPWWRLRRAKAG